MYCSASATLWIKSSCRMTVMRASVRRALARRDRCREGGDCTPRVLRDRALLRPSPLNLRAGAEDRRLAQRPRQRGPRLPLGARPSCPLYHLPAADRPAVEHDADDGGRRCAAIDRVQLELRLVLGAAVLGGPRLGEREAGPGHRVAALLAHEVGVELEEVVVARGDDRPRGGGGRRQGEADRGGEPRGAPLHWPERETARRGVISRRRILPFLVRGKSRAR